jgi:hypothetical protein
MLRSSDVEALCFDLGLYAPKVFRKEGWDNRPNWVISFGKSPDRKTAELPGNMSFRGIANALAEAGNVPQEIVEKALHSAIASHG